MDYLINFDRSYHPEQFYATSYKNQYLLDKRDGSKLVGLNSSEKQLNYFEIKHLCCQYYQSVNQK